MTPVENLHLAMGELAYAIARSDGKIQKEEHDKFLEIVKAEVRSKEYDFDISGIIFQVLEKDNITDSNTSYEWAMREIRQNSHYLSPELKSTFISVMEKIAKAYPPVTAEEKSLLDRFKSDIADIEGDPVFYQVK